MASTEAYLTSDLRQNDRADGYVGAINLERSMEAERSICYLFNEAFHRKMIGRNRMNEAGSFCVVKDK